MERKKLFCFVTHVAVVGVVVLLPINHHYHFC